MTRTPEQAIAWGETQIGKFGWDNLCLSFVRQSFGVDYVGDWPASERQAGRAWDRAKHKHPTSDAGSIPRGVPVFWELATEADHVALSLGNGWCLSNDFVVNGRIDRVRISDISARWGRLLGWTEDLVGNRVVPEKSPVKGMRVDGVDISHHQDGTINYAAAKNAGVKWIYHKATEGATYRDPNYAKRRDEAKAAGIPFGAYHFARAAVGDAEQEARAFLAYATPEPGDLRPALDLETEEGMSLAQIRTWAGTWVRVVSKATGVKPIVYTPFNLGEDVRGCLLWRPRYNDDNRPPELAWDIWQFSNGQLGRPDHVAGFGHVDLNTMRDGLTLNDLLIPEPKKRRPRKVRFNLATINALGHSHTAPGGNKPGWLDSTRRTILLIAIITARRFSLVGLQEFQSVQQAVFRSRASLWGCHAYKDNAVIWLRPMWKALDRGSIDIPYFHGKNKPMPWVVLRRRSPIKRNRKVIAFLSTHNPASVRGDALQWRKQGWELEADWARAALMDPRVVAALVVGDKNSPPRVYRPFIEKRGGTPSHDPDIWGIDWIVGWGDIEFRKGKTVETPRIDKTTDHPVSQAVGVI